MNAAAAGFAVRDFQGASMYSPVAGGDGESRSSSGIVHRVTTSASFPKEETYRRLQKGLSNLTNGGSVAVRYIGYIHNIFFVRFVK